MEKLDLSFWRKAFTNLALAFENEKLHLCQLDGAIGDGDHGASMARGFAEACSQLASIDRTADVGVMFKTAGQAFLSKVGGVTGVIFGTFFIEAGKKAEGLTATDGAALAVMLDNALEAIKKKGKVKEGDKSMVDALAPAVAALKQMIEKGPELKAAMEALYQAAERGSEETKQMAAKVGRVRYQKGKGVGHIDAGSASVAIIFRIMKDSL